MRGGATRISVLASALLVTVAVGCAPDFRGASELDENNQILAVRATPPEVNPGDTVTLDALVHWPEGNPDLYWLVCIPDVGDTFLSCLSNQLADPTDIPICALDPTARFCLAGLGPAVTYTVPEGAFPDDGEDHTFFVNMLAAGADIAQCGEVMMGGAPTPDCLLSLKRVVVSYGEPAELNINPELADLHFGGGPLDATAITTIDATEPEDGDIRLELAVTAEATSIDELYPPGEDPSPFDLVLSFFTTCGTVSVEKAFLSCAPHESTGAPECEPTTVTWAPKTRGPCTFHTVVRDGNGGLGWITRQLEIQ